MFSPPAWVPPAVWFRSFAFCACAFFSVFNDGDDDGSVCVCVSVCPPEITVLILFISHARPRSWSGAIFAFDFLSYARRGLTSSCFLLGSPTPLPAASSSKPSLPSLWRPVRHHLHLRHVLGRLCGRCVLWRGDGVCVTAFSASPAPFLSLRRLSHPCKRAAPRRTPSHLSKLSAPFSSPRRPLTAPPPQSLPFFHSLLFTFRGMTQSHSESSAHADGHFRCTYTRHSLRIT